jgi:hypothetical protein
MLERVAEALGDDLDRVVFVGGIVASFHASEVRLTEDVDCIVDMAMPAYYQLGQRLRARGFREDSSGGVICRWVLHQGGEPISLDIVPTDAKVLGFSTRWYPEAFARAERVLLASGRSVSLVPPLYLVATKLEAFKDRGEGDFLASHDLEDAISVLASSNPLREQIQQDQTPVCEAIREDLRSFKDPLLGALIYHLPPAEHGEVLDTLAAWLLALLAVHRRHPKPGFSWLGTLATRPWFGMLHCSIGSVGSRWERVSGAPGRESRPARLS